MPLDVAAFSRAKKRQPSGKELLCKLNTFIRDHPRSLVSTLCANLLMLLEFLIGHIPTHKYNLAQEIPLKQTVWRCGSATPKFRTYTVLNAKTFSGKLLLVMDIFV